MFLCGVHLYERHSSKMFFFVFLLLIISILWNNESTKNVWNEPQRMFWYIVQSWSSRWFLTFDAPSSKKIRSHKWAHLAALDGTISYLLWGKTQIPEYYFCKLHKLTKSYWDSHLVDLYNFCIRDTYFKPKLLRTT